MKKVFLSIVALAALVALPMSVSAANTVTQSGTSAAKIISPLTVSSQVASLDFGTISLTGATDATLAASSGAISVMGTNGNYLKGAHPATFTVTGEVAQPLTVSISDALVDHKLTGGTTGSVVISDYTFSLSGGDNSKLTTASETMYVGAKIAISADARGAFSGTFSVQVAYN